MLKFAFVGFAATGMALMTTAAAAQDPLTSTLEAFIVEANPAGEETLRPTEEIAPGETIEYKLTYENIGDTPLSDIVISAPVPLASVYVMDSAATPTNARFEVTADDGASWGVPPLMVETETGPVPVPVSEYDLVRWTPTTPIAPSETWTFSYRVDLE